MKNGFLKFRVKVTALLIIVIFAGDALAIWDVVEGFGVGFHEVTVENDIAVQIHLHDSKQSEHKSQPIDTCTLCPCCVSEVNMVSSYFTFESNISLLCTFELQEQQAVNWPGYHIFRPPRSFS